MLEITRYCDILNVNFWLASMNVSPNSMEKLFFRNTASHNFFLCHWSIFSNALSFLGQGIGGYRNNFQDPQAASEMVFRGGFLNAATRSPK